MTNKPLMGALIPLFALGAILLSPVAAEANMYGWFKTKFNGNAKVAQNDQNNRGQDNRNSENKSDWWNFAKDSKDDKQNNKNEDKDRKNDDDRVVISSRRPVINGLTAPRELNVNESGTWSVRAVDTSTNDPLEYSVVWGDESSNLKTVAEMSKNFVQTATFTHSYVKSGTYTPVFTVKNSSGAEAKTSATVRVGDDVDEDNLVVTVKTDKSKYTVNENVVISITAQNRSDEDEVLRFNTGCQVNYKIGGYDSAKDQICTLALTSVTIPAGESHTWSETHTPSEFKLTEGTYTVIGRVIGYGEDSTKIVVGEKVENNRDVGVVSPNGGESWKMDETRTIKWNLPSLWYIKILSALHALAMDIKLIPVSSNDAAFTIVDDYYKDSYDWKVGAINDNGKTVSEGNYKIEVCINGTKMCDTSDNSFSISL